MENKFIDLEGLSTFKERMEEWVSTEIANAEPSPHLLNTVYSIADDIPGATVEDVFNSNNIATKVKIVLPTNMSLGGNNFIGHYTLSASHRNAEFYIGELKLGSLQNYYSFATFKLCPTFDLLIRIEAPSTADRHDYTSISVCLKTGQGDIRFIVNADTLELVSTTEWPLAYEKDVLKKNNVDEYNPTSDYHPATKKYVDDLVSNVATADEITDMVLSTSE